MDTVCLYNDVVHLPTKSHPVAILDKTVLSAIGLPVLPKVDPAKTAPAACMTSDSVPKLCANGKTNGNNMPIVPYKYYMTNKNKTYKEKYVNL